MSNDTNSENGNYVQCLICKRYLQYINAPHLKEHGCTTLDYMIEFPDAPLQSEEMVKDHQLAVGIVIVPQYLIDQRAEGLRKWWKSPAGLKQRKDMSRNPIASRGRSGSEE